MHGQKIKILTIPGSLRKASYNKLLCRYLAQQTMGDVEIEVFELNKLPMFNADLEENLSDEVKNFVAAVESASGIIFSTPEYNNMLPGVMKNACEWLTRPYSSKAVHAKPVAITGATDGGFGTVRAQNQLLLLAQIMGMKTNAKLRLPISHADQLFDKEGNLMDEKMADKLRELVSDLLVWIKS